jgi:hypothetical protein
LTRKPCRKPDMLGMGAGDCCRPRLADIYPQG